MNPRESGFLLLSSHLGDPERQVLTAPQLRRLARAVCTMEPPGEQRELTCKDIMAMGFSKSIAQRVVQLLSQTEQLQWYLRRTDCQPVTRISEGYPGILRRRLGLDAPGCLWLRGDRQLLETPAISLVGSRQLCPENLEFAREAGRQAALQGVTLVSGNAAGADRQAQESCLSCGGSVISVVADCLADHPAVERTLYISEDGYDLPFCAWRALSRNRVIHSLGRITLVAQCTPEKGGTWDGTCKNLKNSWSPVFVFSDGSQAAEMLIDRGAQPVTPEDLQDLSGLVSSQIKMIDQ